MAKSVRASVSKRNRAKLRATVFGPAVDARTERLSAKLKELASQPIIREHKTSSMELDHTGAGSQGKSTESKPSVINEDMDVDTMSVKHTQGRSQKSGRVQKRKKARSSIVFHPHSSKTRKGSQRK
ncbi:hypothetical protein IFM51744_10333 [Aspergillus udagawae]|uniref:DUF2423 domain-containing protein n=1 Tax=Aspergillus udagawae TaxID=91492 RepID=A0A8E0QQ80_9EURO|nr:uncharacterized protein Aud_004880 [Aspergillus udagawae]GFF57806.1 hypothetical protein IFM46972_10903 [Aspergillus udagawae]GFF60456.1 hypothetical protein IFM51744_10333 [Aspergillus udagawae]GFF99004.1 hypothetical protein IFM53868_10079 [Aspergillus udagawae]GFG18840.1 hypothetical protein IFM5058_09420 [Aspergillus udagawae]GIC88485.1 hypothetical protein Aud_004880 [Aspergillus udagawae]